MKDELHVRLAVGQTQMNKIIQSKAKEIGLLPGQTKVLEYVSDHSGCSQKDICKGWALDKSTVSGILSRMKRDGLLQSEADYDDNRINHIYLTERGREKYDIMHKFIQELDTSALKGISQEKQKIFYGIVNQIYENLNQE